MNNDLQKFIKDFKKVKKLGFQVSRRSHNTGIGKTFEDLLGVTENNLTEPDLHGFEIKSQRAYSASYVTLFTKTPTMPIGANAFLKDNYGTPDSMFPEIKVLHTSLFHGTFNTHKSSFKFSLRCNDKERKLLLLVKDSSDKIVSNNIYWSYEVLEKALNKLNRLAYVNAETRKTKVGEEFYFNKATIFFKFKGLDNFLKLLKKGCIMFDLRIGAYKTGINKGKPHDHGSGFRIKKGDMPSLYESFIEI